MVTAFPQTVARMAARVPLSLHLSSLSLLLPLRLQPQLEPSQGTMDVAERTSVEQLVIPRVLMAAAAHLTGTLFLVSHRFIC